MGGPLVASPAREAGDRGYVPPASPEAAGILELFTEEYALWDDVALLVPFLKNEEGGAAEFAVLVVRQLSIKGLAALERGEPCIVFQDGGEERDGHAHPIVYRYTRSATTPRINI